MTYTRTLPPPHVAPSPRLPFALLYRGVVDKLRAYARHLAPNADGDDLLQEAAIRMYRKYEQFEPGTNFEAWGRRVLYHVYCSQYRKRGRARRLRAAAPSSATWLNPGDVDPDAGQHHDHALVEELFERLTPCLSSAFELRYRGLAYHEIAEQLDLPVGTVKSRVFHARRQLRTWYERLQA